MPCSYALYPSTIFNGTEAGMTSTGQQSCEIACNAMMVQLPTPANILDFKSGPHPGKIPLPFSG